jgi:pimeloyl-[acyl-carrier protein] methyl ester esterase
VPRQCLVLLSGWGIDQRIWQLLEGYWPSRLTPQAVEWPGYGDAPALSADATLAQLAESMADSLPSDAIWVGWSLGGLLATALLDYLPAPKGLILLGAGPTFCADDGVTTAEFKAFQRAFLRDPIATWQHFLRWQTQGEPSPRLAYRQLRDLLGDTPPADNSTLSTGLHWLATLDNRPRLAAPPCPVVRLSGEHDPLLGPAQRCLGETLSGVGHSPMLSQPQALAAAITHHATLMANANMAVL